MIQAGAVIKGATHGYRIINEHGRGGFGITYRALIDEDGPEVLIKILRIDRLGDWKALELFEREANVLRALSHPGIPTFIDHFPLDNGVGAAEGFALVQSFVAGDTLRERMRSRRSLSQAEMLGWFEEILQVLAYLHLRNPPVIHRDITPQNIILREDGSAALVDFGSVQAEMRTGQSVSSTAAGTFGYAPMEQFVGRSVPASDLYGLGMTFLAVASGREPEAMPMDGVRVNPRALLGDDGRFPSALVSLLAELTEPDPRRRLGEATQALQRFARIRGGGGAVGLVPHPAATAGISAAVKVADVDAYAALLSSRLSEEGFSLTEGGKLLDLPLLLSAARRGGTLRSAQAFRIQAVVADHLLEPGGRLTFSQVAAFARSCAAAHSASGANQALLSGGAVLVPLVLFKGGTAPDLRPGTDMPAGAGKGTSVVPMVVDLERSAVHLVPAAGVLGKDGDGVLPYLWWLASPRILDKPKWKGRSSPLLRVGLISLGVSLLLALAGIGYLALLPSGTNFAVYASDPSARRFIAKRLYAKSAVLDTETAAAAVDGKDARPGRLPANAFLCGFANERVTYYVPDREHGLVTYWSAASDGGDRRRIATTPYSFWWSCAIHGDRIAFATGDKETLGLIQIQQGMAAAMTATGSEPGDKFPAWFPDGQRLVVSNGAWGTERLVEINLASGTRTLVGGEEEGKRSAAIRPVVSPEGDRIAYYRGGRRSFGDDVRRPTSDVYDLCLLDPVVKEAKLIIQDVCFGTGVAWLSNEEFIYTKWSNGECALFTYHLQTEESRRLPGDF